MVRPSPKIKAAQQTLPTIRPVAEAISLLANSGFESRGAIFTRREVVEFILDLLGYTSERPLCKLRLLEPSFGEGDFLLPAVDRLLQSWISQRPDLNHAVDHLGNSLCAVELHKNTFENTKLKVLAGLTERGISYADAQTLADKWLIQGDFLLEPLVGSFDVVAGNPPYLRQELIPDVLMSEYRERYETIYDRADLYIPFIERSLKSLAPNGELGFICADRWMKNRYGGPLRQLVTDHFHLTVYVDMVNTPAFRKDVSAYPAITIIKREKSGATRIAYAPEINSDNLSTLSSLLLAPKITANDGTVYEVSSVGLRDEPWLLDPSKQLALMRRLEADFPTIEDTGCKVGIGVATGADEAFIGEFELLDVEPSRKLPLVMTRDILDGVVNWRGFGVINPFEDDGGLVELKDFPRLARYLEERKHDIAKRHVAQKSPAGWYRTIDRIYPALARSPKLLIPDIKGTAHVVYEEGRLYPHHNLYFVTSREWDLKALQAVLLSNISRMFVSMYSTKMRGGYLRFQAQYLRRIRIPSWDHVPISIRKSLIAAAESQDLSACNRAVFDLYSLDKDERIAIESNGLKNGTSPLRLRDQNAGSNYGVLGEPSKGEGETD